MKKQVVISIIATAIICITGTSYAAYKLKAEQVSFDNNKLLEGNNVQEALDELSELASVQIKQMKTDINNIDEKMNDINYILSLCGGYKEEQPNIWRFEVPFDKAPNYASTTFHLPIDLSKYQVTVKSARFYRRADEFASNIEIRDLNGYIALLMKKDTNDLTGVMTYRLVVEPK